MLSSSVWRGSSHWWFVSGLLAGGAVMAVLLVALGSLVRPLLPAPAVWGVVAVVMVVVLLGELGVVRLPLPQNARQVPRTIVAEGARYGALQFGFEMGTGVRTYMTSGLPHLLALVVFLGAGLGAGLVAGIGFGAGRGLMTLSRRLDRQEGRWDRRFAAWSTWLRVALALGACLCVLTILYSAR